MSYIEEVLSTPHALIAGTTGSGKSVCLNGIIYEILKRHPLTAQMVLFDLKRVELKRYKDAPHTLGFFSEPYEVIEALDAINEIIDWRYRQEEVTSDIYVVIDELADTLSVKGALERVVRIGRIGRAARVHLICATQDPSRRTLKAQLMQNFTLCIALRCRSAIESRQIIGSKGAEMLPQYGHGIQWDARGTHEIEIEMVPDEDIREIVGLSKEACPELLQIRQEKKPSLGPLLTRLPVLLPFSVVAGIVSAYTYHIDKYISVGIWLGIALICLYNAVRK